MIFLRSMAVVLAAAVLSGNANANEDVLRLSRDPATVAMPGITYNGWNYSSLEQVNATNVKNLSLAWTLQIGILDSHEASPLVVGDTMYVVSPRPNYLYAFDLADDGVIKWEFRPLIESLVAPAQSCCGSGPRGIYFADHKLFYTSADGQLMAIDAESGQLIWRTEAADVAHGEYTAGTGLVVGNTVVVGTGGDGARGRVRAFDLWTGAAKWSVYNTGPDADIGLRARFQKNYPYLSGANPGAATWFGDSWARGGAGAQGPFTFDPDANLLFYSTATCSPRNPDYRRERGKLEVDAAGRLTAFYNNFCSSQMARDAATGELIWAYNLTPQDMWGFDELAPAPLIDVTVGGKAAKAVAKVGGNGLLYVWDRVSGKLLLEPWMHTFQDVIKGPAFVDMQTGLPGYDLDKTAFTAVDDRRRYSQADPAAERKPQDYTGTEILFCPGNGARKWESDAYSPKTGLLYTHTTNSCAATVVLTGEYKAGDPYTLVRRANVPQPRKDAAGQATTVQSEVKALDPVNRKVVWSRALTDEARSGQLVTAGDLVFKGNGATGSVEAYNARTGESLWAFRSGSGFAQSPITYQFHDSQYVAVVASSPAVSAPLGFGAAADAAARFRRAGTSLYVFCMQPCSP